MTVEECVLRIQEIKHQAERGDDERAHSMEDKLHCEALQMIADGHPQPAAIATIVLETLKLDFARWCA